MTVITPPGAAVPLYLSFRAPDARSFQEMLATLSQLMEKSLPTALRVYARDDDLEVVYRIARPLGGAPVKEHRHLFKSLLEVCRLTEEYNPHFTQHSEGVA